MPSLKRNSPRLQPDPSVWLAWLPQPARVFGSRCGNPALTIRTLAGRSTTVKQTPRVQRARTASGPKSHRVEAGNGSVVVSQAKWTELKGPSRFDCRSRSPETETGDPIGGIRFPVVRSLARRSPGEMICRTGQVGIRAQPRKPLMSCGTARKYVTLWRKSL